MSRCKKSQEGLGHVYPEDVNTCVEDQICERCGNKKAATGHKFSYQSCTNWRKCTECGEWIEPVGHRLSEATCTKAATCSVCGETSGDRLGHDRTNASCTKDWKCARCGAVLSALGHTTDNGTCGRCYQTIGNTQQASVNPGSSSAGNSSYILNKNTGVFHYPSCGSVKKMKEKNKIYYTGTRDAVISQGYKPCGNCHP